MNKPSEIIVFYLPELKFRKSSVFTTIWHFYERISEKVDSSAAINAGFTGSIQPLFLKHQLNFNSNRAYEIVLTEIVKMAEAKVTPGYLTLKSNLHYIYTCF